MGRTTGTALVLSLLAGCRLYFDPQQGDAADATDAPTGFCAQFVTPYVCDDFESDGYMPWELSLESGTISEIEGCGVEGSRCLRTVGQIEDDNTRYVFQIRSSLTKVHVEATITPRVLGTGITQVLAVDLRAGPTAVIQVGVEVRFGSLTLYDYSFGSGTSNRTPTLEAMAVDVPALLALTVDITNDQLVLARDSTTVGTHPVPFDFNVADRGTVLVGLYTVTGTSSFDFDEVVARP